MKYVDSFSRTPRVQMNSKNLCSRLTPVGRFIRGNFGRRGLNIVLKIERFLSYKK